MAHKLPYSQDYDTAEQNAVWDGSKPQLTLDEAIRRSQEFLLSLQHPDGYWWAELEANATITVQTLLLYKILGIEHRYPLDMMENHIRRTQCDHGGWEMFYGEGNYLSATIECYMALRLLNVPKTDPALQRARKVIIEGGGISKSRVFTKICLALIGCYDWKGIPSLPPWIMLLPTTWSPFSIYDTACWARGCVVPLVVIFDKKPVFKLTPEVSLDELYAEGRKNVHFNVMPFAGGGWATKLFVAADYAFKAMERFDIVPFRHWGMKEAERWLLERQEDSGDFLGVYPPMFYSILCFKILGYEVNNPVLERAINSLKVFTVEIPRLNECRVQSALSPVWDTALTVRALVESGIRPDHPALQKAGRWLLKKQILKHGDWSYKNPSLRMGGWAFQFFNRWYPDVDDTATVLMALHALKMEDEDVKNGAIAQGIEWVRCMQCREGGWAAYDKDHDRYWLNYTPFGDLKAMIDPNTVDVSARVLEMVGRLKKICMEGPAPLFSAEAIARGLAYLRKEQEEGGCWYGRWGVNYIYGTSLALEALSLAAPPHTHEEEMRRGVKWLVEVQNKRGGKMARDVKATDGGWGESCMSYVDASLKGKGEVSTASQTAWALQGLLAAGDALGSDYERESIQQGVHFLLATQRQDGSWYEPQFTGGGFPAHFYLRYHFYAQHFPLSALSRYRHRQSRIAPTRE